MTHLLMLAMLREMQKGKSSGFGGDPADGSLDGLRIVKAMSGMRALKRRMRRFPRKITREYRAHWIDKLGAHGKAWNWRDVGQAIGFDRYKSMLRIFVGCGAVEDLLEGGRPEEAHAQLVPLMLSLIHI